MKQHESIMAVDQVIKPEYAIYQGDACELIRNGRRFPAPVLVDQGTADKFLKDQLRPELLEAACKHAGQPLELRMHSGYDHGYFFIQTFMRDHIEWHARHLNAGVRAG